MPRRGENIRKRADGRWEGRYIESYSNTGKACYHSVYGSTYAETKEKLQHHKKLNQQGIRNNADFQSLCNEWLNMKKESIKESTYVKYLNFIEKHFEPFFKGFKAMLLTCENVQEFVSSKSSLSAKSVHDMLSVLVQIIKYGQSKRYIGYFNFDALVYPKVPSRELPVLKSSEFSKLVSYIQSTFEIQKIGILLSLFMGLRIGEICALKWADIDSPEEIIRISKTMQRLKNYNTVSNAKTKVIIDAPKSQKSIREIPVPSFLMHLLSQYRANDDTYVLTGTTDYIEPRVYQQMFKRYLSEAGIADINFHALRHTFATRAVEQEFDVKSLSEILGHSSVRFTLERYVHPSDEYKKMNLEKLAVFY